MNWRRSLTCLLVSALCPAIFPAALSAQMVFERSKIIIQPAPAAPSESDKDNTTPLPPREPVSLDVELRNEEALRLEYIHELNTLSPETGVMIALSVPGVAPLPAMSVFTPVDAVFIDEEGTILQIVPNVILGEMTRSIAARRPIKALLFLKAGQAAARAIRPHDIVAGSSFIAPLPVEE